MTEDRQEMQDAASKGDLSPQDREIEYLNLKVKLMTVMSRHIGRTRAIGMGELFEEIYGDTWNHRINDTRKLRKLITKAKEEGFPILSSPAQTGGGYYLSGSDSEMDAFYAMRRGMALKILAIEAKMRRLAMPELLGQIAMNL